MPHVHDPECERLHGALRALQAQQQPPRGAMGTLGGQLINPERGLSPEGDAADVETEIANVRRALDAMECDR
ncbi:MAG: hypothetical protein U0446_06650 [Dehalococcoidia bacterium]